MVFSRQSLPLRQSQPPPGTPFRGALGLRQPAAAFHSQPCGRSEAGGARIAGNLGSRQQGCLKAKAAAGLPQSMWLALSAALVLSACGKPEMTQPATEQAPKPVTATPALSERQLDAEIGRALAPSRAEREAELVDRAEAVLDQYPGKNVTELLNTPEVNASLKVALTKLAENKPLQDQINNTVALAAQMQGLSGAPGSSRLDLDTSNYDSARKSRLLQAVLSEDPRRIVGFIAQEIGEAVPELSFEGAERASNGVAIKENPPPAK